MSLQTFFILYGMSVPIFFIVDMVWLGLVARGFYQSKLGHLLGEVNWVAAIVFYLVFLLGLTFFATLPAVTASRASHAVLYGALFGFFTYATYDLTNLATLKGWPLSVTVVDMVWGTILGATVAGLVYWVYTWLF
jgi:uncharacterized membrane protein